MELTQVKHEIETLAEKYRNSMALKYSGEPALWRPHLWQNTGAESRE